MIIHNQNTHWYKPAWGSGWTANPLLAAEGEVEKRGLHDCITQGCKEHHGSSAEEILTNEIRASQVARGPKS